MKSVARYESKFQSFSTIGHINCKVLLSSSISAKSCFLCTNYRKLFNPMLSRHHQQFKSTNTSTSINSHTNYRYLSSDDRTIRLHQLYNALQAIRQMQHLKDKIDTNKSIAISREMRDSFLKTMEGYNKKVSKDNLEQSFPRLFWQKQMQATSVKDARAMKWHSLMIKWCFYLQHKSSGAYELVRDSG